MYIVSKVTHFCLVNYYNPLWDVASKSVSSVFVNVLHKILRIASKYLKKILVAKLCHLYSLHALILGILKVKNHYFVKEK